ncbi:hypothetical protein FVO59_12830 [Microbacterium esteraromaticum]|uniref:Uncharacterized protein n=1 Tax=Microbacterium esteraromaticum TaxID=57043 RepID=A0A7D8AMM4_9MICO|nr:hypothetical protein [Microbacterium esteraromaticum]QMU97988.1 hypothetical protein FVO59_12830 [Microbacterium esteraromaticum]
MTVPVMIHLPIETFKALERVADRKGIAMRDLIVAGLMRSTQPRPQRTSGQVPSSTPGGGSARRHYRRLDAAEWRELRQLRAAGWSVPELAVKYGCSSSIIYRHLQNEKR